MLSIKKNDQVKVLSGKDRGKTGKVLGVDLLKGRVLVEHVQLVKRHTRPNPSKNIKGGIIEKESWLSRSNVMLVCPSCGPIRFRHHSLADGRKVRACCK